MAIYSPRVKKGRRRIAWLFILTMLGALLAGSAWSALSLLRDLPRPERILERSIAQSTRIYDRSGEVLLYEIHGEEKRTVIVLEKIPEKVRLATIAAEDDTFYRHHGLDFKGVVRAAIKNILSGDITQGGSTITQQLVKNSLLGPERTFKRKLREQMLAVLLERKYSKDEILELYLNQIPYGSNAYGLAAASQTFFRKKVEELTLAEAATLAALPKAPTYFSPYGSHQKELLARKDWILDRMADIGSVTAEEAHFAKKVKLSFAPPRSSIRAPHFVLYVREYLNQKFGEDFVERGGLKVLTTLDWKLQSAAEGVIREGTERNEELVQAANASLVAINPKTGEILAMVGSRDYWEKPIPEGCTPGLNCRFDPHVNVALRQRQPGSAFKPFVYATALKKGYTPETILFDVPTEFNPLCNPDGIPTNPILDPKECYRPRNYDGSFRGPVSIRQALAQSLNIPSVKLLYLAGIQDSIKTAENFGITTLTSPERYGLSLVLGGAEVTLIEMVSAFGALANDGILHPKTAVLRIENPRGEILEENKESSLEVLDPETARALNDILSDNEARIPMFSPRSSLYFPERRVAAKTGTTEDFRDAWVIGYTPSLSTGVWVGNNNNEPMNKSSLSIMVAAPIWHRFLETALADTPPEDFTPPIKKTVEKPALRGFYRTGPLIKIDKISKKLATIYTPPELIEELATGKIKSILAQLKKEDPLGNAPEDPIRDPQYQNWQAGIELWLKEENHLQDSPPQEYDDLHTPDKKPKITLPQELAAPVEKISVKVKSVFPLREVSLFINDSLAAAKTSPIVSEDLTFLLPEPLDAATYKIKLTAYDAVGNRETVEEEITISRSE